MNESEINAVWERVLGRIRSGPITVVSEANAVLMDLYALASHGVCVVARGRSRLATMLPGFAMVVHELQPTKNDIVGVGGSSFIYTAAYLRIIAETAGLRTRPAQRLDDGENPHMRVFTASVEGLDMACRPRVWNGWYDKVESGGSPKHLTAKGETGAKSRARAEALALTRTFANEREALLPLYIPAMVFHAESAEPETRAAVSKAAALAVMGIYGVQQTAAEEPPEEPEEQHEEREPHDDIPLDMGSSGGGSFPAPPDETTKREDPDPYITAEQAEEMKDCGVTQDDMREQGWDGEWPCRLSIYRKVMARLEEGGGQ